MRILYVITQADGGGAQKYTLMLAKHFGGSIAAGSKDNKLFKAAQDLQLTTYSLKHLKRAINPWHDFMAVWEIRQLIKTCRPDIVHLNSSKAGVIGSFAAIGLKTKVVYTAHGFIFNEPLPWVIKSLYLALERVASDFRDYIIAVSEADEKSAYGYNLISPNKISTIHNGLEAVKFEPKEQARNNLNLYNNKIIVGCLASFYKTKGVDILIEAASILGGDIKGRLQIVVIGDGPERKSLELRITDYGLRNTIRLLGKIENASAYLKAFDILAMPSRKEGFPFVLLEAMQAGLPIIATRVGGISEGLDDCGLLIEPENPKALAEAIENLYKNLPLRQNLSQLALERSKLFTAEKMLEETKKVYEKTLLN